MQNTALNELLRRIPPVRGLVVTHNARGKAYSITDLKRWVRLCRTAYAAPKIDVHSDVPNSALMVALLKHAETLDTCLSLRTTCAEPPVDLSAIKEAGLYDVCLAPPTCTSAHLIKWMEACRSLGLAMRLEIPAGAANAEELASVAAEYGVVSVTLCLEPRFQTVSPQSTGPDAAQRMNDAAAALIARGIDTSIVDLPFCMVSEELRAHCLNSQQYFQDHLQYRKKAYDLASLLFDRSTVAGSKIVAILLAQHTLHRSKLEARIMPWLVNRPWIYARIVALHKLTRHLRFLPFRPKVAQPEYVVQGEELNIIREKACETLQGVCTECSLRRICDHVTPELRRALPEAVLEAQPGELVYSPFHYASGRERYYDSIDAERVDIGNDLAELAREVGNITTNRPPDIRITPYDYKAETTLCAQYEGAVKWMAVTNSEHLSTPLATITPPCTVSVTFGGGMAEYIGFSFGRQCKVVCPMEACRHTLTLHIEADGRYVLLRDDIPIRPSEFEGSFYAPLRLGSRLDMRLSVWNIDLNVLSQFVDIWEAKPPTGEPEIKAKYSVIVMCTRYARRLQAALRALAHQEDFDLRKLEVIVAHVPGLDATEDLVTSMQMSYPDLHILRAPFPERCANSKGFIINETRRMATGEWVVLLDSDIVVHPRMFSEMERLEKGQHFLACDGRKMLTPETTAKIVLGEVEPWRQWQEVFDGPGEYRAREAHGVPIGFFQCVRAECMEKVRYEEMDHFEGADMRFGIGIIETFGDPLRLLGFPVLHLDHGGSQWYGSVRHR